MWPILPSLLAWFCWSMMASGPTPPGRPESHGFAGFGQQNDTAMKKPFLSMCLLAASLALAGCSTSSLLSGNRGPDAAAVPQGRNLAMPPDLQLPAPGSGTASAYQEPAPPPGGYSAAAAAPLTDDGVYGGAPATPRRVGGTQCKSGARAADIYGCYNINKLNRTAPRRPRPSSRRNSAPRCWKRSAAPIRTTALSRTSASSSTDPVFQLPCLRRLSGANPPANLPTCESAAFPKAPSTASPPAK